MTEVLSLPLGPQDVGNDKAWMHGVFQRTKDLEAKLKRAEIENRMLKNFLRTRHLALDLPNEDLDAFFDSPSKVPLLKALALEKIDAQVNCVKQAPAFFPIVDRLADFPGCKVDALGLIINLAVHCAPEPNCSSSKLYRPSSSWSMYPELDPHKKATNDLDTKTRSLVQAAWKEGGENYDPTEHLEQLNKIQADIEEQCDQANNYGPSFQKPREFLPDTLWALKEVMSRLNWLRILQKTLPGRVPVELLREILEYMHDKGAIMAPSYYKAHDKRPDTVKPYSPTDPYTWYWMRGMTFYG